MDIKKEKDKADKYLHVSVFCFVGSVVCIFIFPYNLLPFILGCVFLKYHFNEKKIAAEIKKQIAMVEKQQTSPTPIIEKIETSTVQKVIEVIKEGEQSNAENTDDNEQEDLFSWVESAKDEMYLIADESISKTFPKSSIKYRSVMPFSDEFHIYEPNSIIETMVILISNEGRILYEFPIVLDKSSVVLEHCLFLGTHSSRTPFAILKVSTNPQVILNYEREQKRLEMERQERMKLAAKQEKEKIAAKIKEKHERRQLEKLVRQEMIERGELFGEQPKRPPIPREVVDAVYIRDREKCVYCGSSENLQLDHIIPFSKGGATNIENLQILCQKCNIQKSNKIG